MAGERCPSSNLRNLMLTSVWILQTQMTLVSNLSVCVLSSQNPVAQREGRRKHLIDAG